MDFIQDCSEILEKERMPYVIVSAAHDSEGESYIKEMWNMYDDEPEDGVMDMSNHYFMAKQLRYMADRLENIADDYLEEQEE